MGICVVTLVPHAFTIAAGPTPFKFAAVVVFRVGLSWKRWLMLPWTVGRVSVGGPWVVVG